MRFGRNRFDLLNRTRESDQPWLLPCLAQAVYGKIVVAASIAEAHSDAIESDHRHDNELGHDWTSGRWRLARPERSRHRLVAGRIMAKYNSVVVDDGGQSGFYTFRPKPFDEGLGLAFAAKGPVQRNARRPERIEQFAGASGDDGAGSRPRLRAQRIAARQRLPE